MYAIDSQQESVSPLEIKCRRRTSSYWLTRAITTQAKQQKAKRSCQRREGKAWEVTVKESQSQKQSVDDRCTGCTFGHPGLLASRTGSSPEHARWLLMCWQLLFCVPIRIGRGLQYMSSDCGWWANVDGHTRTHWASLLHSQRVKP